MVRTAQKTLYATDLNLHMLTGKSYAPLANTTLNEKFMLNTNVEIPKDSYPKLRYLVIGVGGNSVINGDNTYTTSEHSPLDAALFEQIPFVVRPVNSDLSPTERANYRLRVIKIISGTTYACYYAKVLPDMDIPSYFNSIETIVPKGEYKLPYSTIGIFDTNIPEILNPVPRNRQIDITRVSSTKRVTKLGRITLQFTEYDLKEIRNSIELLGLTAYNIRELGLCTGWDVATNVMTEVVGLQIMYHIGMTIGLALDLNTETSLTRIIEMGGEEPLVY